MRPGFAPAVGGVTRRTTRKAIDLSHCGESRSPRNEPRLAYPELELAHHESMFRLDGSGFGLTRSKIAAHESTLAVSKPTFAHSHARPRLSVIEAGMIECSCAASMARTSVRRV